jgi:hypothetical protein
MKKIKKFRYLQTGTLLVLFGLLFAVSSCDDDDDDKGSDEVVFRATLNGSSEVPSNTSSATGDAVLTFNEATDVFTIVVNYSGVDATGAHIHKGAPTESGGVVFPFDQLASPINYTSPPLDSMQKADLFANLYYVNIHSAAYPAGEIRGQLVRE